MRTDSGVGGSSGGRGRQGVPCPQAPQEARKDPPLGGGEACRPPIPDFRPPELETVRFCGCNHLVCRTLFWQHQDTKALSVEATGAPGGSPGWSRSFEDP